MAQKARLRENRYGTVINVTSSKQEVELGKAFLEASEALIEKFGLVLAHRKSVPLSEIVGDLRATFPTVEFEDPLPRSAMSPDGGILSTLSADGEQAYPILITEVKNQGTNDLRLSEGKEKQAMGNAIERLGKNVIGFRTMMLDEGIVLFVCFGYGYDFQDGSSILDRVRTIAMFGKLNKVNVVGEGEDGRFNRGSFFFRREPWTRQEMVDVMTEVGVRAINYYFAKYGESAFKRAAS
ncbi:EcoRI family type II restriction endonuclease [Gryllotalpicola sp.]|uniref:EcoRI family type II restriction endonuclease n=1 Tax=Gryllotalpicola sp. TaxID=1932787 RepID=UPI002622025E|nr:EcoRI family type II restriction endonuclease [Gryllotalpicola sp.]